MGLNFKGLIHESRLILAVGVCLALVSMVAEVQLFMDYAQKPNDKGLAALTALALVACQFLFVGLAIDMWRKKHFCLAAMLALVLLLLVLISVTGTAAFFESRFASTSQQSTVKSDQYKMQLTLIDDLEQQRQDYRRSANELSLTGNPLNAARKMAKAEKALEDKKAAIEKLATIKSAPANSGSALVDLAGNYRWLVWYTLAALVDVCALLCFAVLAVGKNKEVLQTQTVKVQTNTQTQTTKHTLKQTIDSQTQAGPTNEQTAREVTANKKAEQAQEVKRQILSGFFGDEPGVRKVMEHFSIKTHSVVAAIFEELASSGDVRRHENGKKWLLVQKQLIA
jgi:uncharacterized protein YpmS